MPFCNIYIPPQRAIITAITANVRENVGKGFLVHVFHSLYAFRRLYIQHPPLVHACYILVNHKGSYIIVTTTKNTR